MDKAFKKLGGKREQGNGSSVIQTDGVQLNLGVISACLSRERKVLEERERSKMWVKEFRIEQEGGRSSCDGTGPRGQVVRQAVERSLATSSVLTGLKEESVSVVLDLLCWLVEEAGRWISHHELC